MYQLCQEKEVLAPEEPNWGGIEPLVPGMAVLNKNEGDTRGRGNFRGKVAAIPDVAALLPPLNFLYSGLLCSVFAEFLLDLFQA